MQISNPINWNFFLQRTKPLENMFTRMSMEVIVTIASKLGYFTYVSGTYPTYLYRGYIHLLSTMDIPVTVFHDSVTTLPILPCLPTGPTGTGYFRCISLCSVSNKLLGTFRSWYNQGWWLPGTPKDMGPPYGKRDPYHSHIFKDSYGSGMGIVWGPRGPIIESHGKKLMAGQPTHPPGPRTPPEIAGLVKGLLTIGFH